MKKIFKYLCYCLPVMALAVGCTEADGISEFQPDTNKTGNVTLLASIENADSRASVLATGEARWERNDAIKVVCDNGQTAIFTLDGTGDTRRALFTGNLEGKSVGEYALYPTTSEISGDNISLELPSQVAASPTGICAFMAGVINEKNEVEFKQLTAYVNAQINKISSDTASVVFSSDKNLSGTISGELPTVMTDGAAAVAGDATVSVVFEGAAPTMLNVFFALPVGEYAHITATAYNANGKKIGEVVLGSLVSASRGLLLNYNTEMPEVKNEKPAPIEGTVNVAGVYWALGNLQYQKDGAADAGFNAGWRIAPSQEYFYHSETTKSGDLKNLTNFDLADHFNYGGITDPFSPFVEASVTVTDPAFNLSGKLYLDQACTTETTDFAAAKYGDIAYWASNGKFRMPTMEDFKALEEKASATYGTYNGIAGILFTDPEPGTDPVKDVTLSVEFTAEQIATGLFLPLAGRGYNRYDNGTEYNLYKLGSQGIYRGANVYFGDGADQPSYGLVYAIMSTGTDKALPYWNKAFDAKGRYSIRPVYLGEGSGTVTPTPTPDPDPTPDPTPDVPVDLPEFVTVAGIEWSMGNLEYEVGTLGATGFAAGWSLAPHPAHHFHLGSSGNLEDRDNYNQVSHFNFGGIADPITNLLESAVSLATTEPAFDFSGKMYTDRSCINETTDFAAAQFGDIAFWASNGTLRTPSADDFVALYTKASRTKAVYTYEGVEVNGTYFIDPAAGTEPVIDTENVKVLTSADLAVGLFLPHSGRTYAANDYKLYAVNSIGVYRTTTVNLNSTLEATNGVIYRVSYIQESEKNSKGLNGSFYNAGWGANGRYAIRPVKVK